MLKSLLKVWAPEDSFEDSCKLKNFNSKISPERNLFNAQFKRAEKLSLRRATLRLTSGYTQARSPLCAAFPVVKRLLRPRGI
jgi:carotenoid cleavage dioxygenase-like enzyme